MPRLGRKRDRAGRAARAAGERELGPSPATVLVEFGEGEIVLRVHNPRPHTGGRRRRTATATA